MTLHIEETKNSRNYTLAASVGAVFGFPRTLESITIHHWGSHGQDFDVVTDYLCTNTTPTSAHFVVERGRAACVLSPADAAWHAGNGRGNASSIGIECRPEATDADVQAAAELVALLRSICGALPLVNHADWAPTACPGIWDITSLDARARGLDTPAEVPATPVSHPKPDTKRKTYGDGELHWIVRKGDMPYSIARYYNNEGGVDALVEHNGVKAEGLVIGERIWIPGPLAWIIEGPDEIRTIADYYGVDPTWLARFNELPHADATIYVGNTLWIKR